jgi:hypothetical protein
VLKQLVLSCKGPISSRYEVHKSFVKKKGNESNIKMNMIVKKDSKKMEWKTK